MVKLVINGVERELDVPEDMPLLWVLREVAGMTGTKFGCGAALCGACTVHVNGIATRSCVMPVGTLAGQRITTIEGLAQGGVKHPCQRAWMELSVPQCGYCQSGQIMSASALLAAQPEPTNEDIDAVMAGNLCRCGTYPRIRAAIHRASELAKQERVDLKAAIGVAEPKEGH
ncbi:(2Fe-2S)-binding protein [Hyalangium sp.]|uniref:(2Fe-2S)-binding protein n=1 Tax=Hyalangium sp. TaxID=2028555 RepID=UPI002D2AA849|nr:(2Fe-2S)-binding protein [Hyalangium sp.]HYI02616.1 (2Fe-2S)-binding protein [Hyalangium sp.]